MQRGVLSLIIFISSCSLSLSSPQRSRQSYAGKVLNIAPRECTSPDYPRVIGTCMISLECQQRAGMVIGACRDGHLFGACCSDAAPTAAPIVPTTQAISSDPKTFVIPQALLDLANFNIADRNDLSHLPDESTEDVQPTSISTIETTITTKIPDARADPISLEISTQPIISSTEQAIIDNENDDILDTKPKQLEDTSPTPLITDKDGNEPDLTTTTEFYFSTKFSYPKIKYSPRPTFLKPRLTTAKTHAKDPGVNPTEEENATTTDQVNLITASSVPVDKLNNKIWASESSVDTTTESLNGTDEVNEQMNISDSSGTARGRVQPEKLSRLSNDLDGEVSEDWDSKLDDFVNQVVEGIAEELDKSNIDDVVFKKKQQGKKPPATSKKATTTTEPPSKPAKNHKKHHKKTSSKDKEAGAKKEKKKASSSNISEEVFSKPASGKNKKKKPAKKEEPVPDSAEMEHDVLDYREVCGVRPLARHARIVGGNPSIHGNWPWHALVKETVWWGIFSKIKCGGVLIGRQHVLTAAHCQPQQTGTLSVVLGVTDSDNPSSHAVTKAVRRVIRHPHFNPRTYENDIAILELDSPVQFQPHIVPICLPQPEENFVGKKGFVTGMGLLKHNGERPSILYEVDVPILNNTDCQKMFRRSGNMKPIKPSFICAGYRNGRKDSCGGDSGGPLSVKRSNGQWVLAGTVSHGIKCAVPNQPGIYMRTTWYLPWIEKIRTSARSDLPKCNGPPPLCERREARSGGLLNTIFRIFRIAKKMWNF